MENSLQHNWESVFFDTYNKIIEDNIHSNEAISLLKICVPQAFDLIFSKVIMQEDKIKAVASIVNSCNYYMSKEFNLLQSKTTDLDIKRKLKSSWYDKIRNDGYLQIFTIFD